MPTSTIWRLLAHQPALAQSLSYQARLSPAISQLLVNRGVTDAGAARAFLDPTLDQLHPPRLLPGLAAAADVLTEACRHHKKVCVYGDYDVDGTTATAVLYGMLKLCGADASYYIPDRRTEGYGLNPDAVRERAKEGIEVIVTVDCGATAVEAARVAKSLGVRLVITDHHEFQGEHPDAAAIVHPHLDDGSYPNRSLCGVGVAFKLAWGLAQAVTGRDRLGDVYGKYLHDVLPLVALGTVADVMPLTGENRAIVAQGLSRLQSSPSPGLQALVSSAELRNPALTSETVSYQLAPRLNAAGRLAHAAKVVDLLTTRDRIHAQTLAETLDELNVRRRQLERKLFDEAVRIVEDEGYDAEPGIVVAGAGWNHGVVGIVASKLAKLYAKPTLVIGLGDHEGEPLVSGSARSVANFPLHLALAACQPHLVSHGGHAAAAGFRLHRDSIPALRKAFSEAVREHFPAGVPAPEVVAESEIPLSAVGMGLLNDLDRLEPTGCGNAKPVFLASDVTIEDTPRRMGKDAATLGLKLRQGGTVVRAVGFGMGDRHDSLITPERKCSVMFTVERNVYNGYTNAELRVVDIRPGADPRLNQA